MIKIFCLFLIIQSAYFGSIEEISSKDSKYNNVDYINFFKIPFSLIKLTTSNVDFSENNNLFKAFDGREDTLWKAQMQQDNSCIITKFLKAVQIDRIIFKSVTDNYELNPGHTLKLKIYSRENENDNFILCDEFDSRPTKEKIIIELKNIINCYEIKLEWSQIYGEKIASPNEISFLMPENDYANESIMKIFSSEDYRQFIVSKDFDDIKIINTLIDKSKEILEISKYARDYLYKAKKIIQKKMNLRKNRFLFEDEQADPKREFTTNPSARLNKIKQLGDIDSYARSILKMTWVGTNRQVTGIYGICGETISVYVEADENDPLPSIRFTQYIGPWQKWFSNVYPLKLGKNVLTFDIFEVKDYEIKVNPGGPIYLINPYLSSQQSQNVKVYIEGGIVFPIFRLNDNQDEYKQVLSQYIQLYNEHLDTYLDVTELESDRAIITVPASKAYNVYKEQFKGPQDNLKKWDEFLKQLYTYDGVQFDPAEPHYSMYNFYLNIHFRYSQPYGGAYAYTEHIGIFYDDWIDLAIDAKVGAFGWGFAHEIGHMMDIGDRTVSETSNNMISKYSETYLEQDGSWGTDHYRETLAALTPDGTNVLLRGCKEADTSNCKGFFNNWQLNFLVFWDLESLYHGYWGKLDNYYRFNYDQASRMSRTERFIYFTNIILGQDLGYYFTRWGFYIGNDDLFDEDEAKTSSAYKTAMDKAIQNGTIDKNAKKRKFWYLDYKEYNYIEEDGSGCYENQEDYDVQISSVLYDGYKTTILLPFIDCPGHLGFEIYEHDTLIGFTYGTSFEDKTRYVPGYEVKYKIVAYDRLLDESKESDYKIIE